VPVAGNGTKWRTPLEPAPPRPAREVAAQELVWVRGFVVPRIGRRLRGQSSGDGRLAKRLTPEPVGHNYADHDRPVIQLFHPRSG
jgi:hypothetical protein